VLDAPIEKLKDIEGIGENSDDGFYSYRKSGYFDIN
jgi:hypothetical protein